MTTEKPRVSRTTKHLIETLRIVADPSESYGQEFIAGFRNAVTAALMSDGWEFDDAKAYLDQLLAS
jgi:hypothetical protein